jgi:23S rRNA maturation mini-RNase III
VLSIALEAELQSRKENTVSLAWLSDFVLDHPTAVRLIAPLQNRIKILENSSTKILIKRN